MADEHIESVFSHTTIDTLMGVQNYFSNWAEATQFIDQTAARIMDDLVTFLLRPYIPINVGHLNVCCCINLRCL